MFLENIQLFHFKNYTERKFDFSSGINAISGKNGVGKTNLLDAIHYLSVCKSYYTTSDQQNIRHGDDFFALHGFFHEDGIDGVTQVSPVNRHSNSISPSPSDSGIFMLSLMVFEPVICGL